jgi:energy-coupling factor transporter ATP-binding protein EcfA2
MPENALYFDDNLQILRNEIRDENVGLAYLNPPFNSTDNFSLLFDPSKQINMRGCIRFALVPLGVALKTSKEHTKENSVIKEYVIKKLLDAAYDRAKKHLFEARAGFFAFAGTEEIERSLAHHLTYVKNWSEEVSFKDLKRPKNTVNIFIGLDLFVYPSRIRIAPNETIEKVNLYNLLDATSRHIVVLGQPGAGKTTSMKYLCQLLLHDENFDDGFSIPIVIALRDLNPKETNAQSSIIIDQLYEILGIRLDLPSGGGLPGTDRERNALKEKLVVTFLEELGALLIIDGYDELTQHSIRERVIHEVENLAAHLDRSKLILTSRTGEFNHSFDNLQPFELCPLAESQITQFAGRWLDDEQKAEDFLTKVRSSPFADTAMRPLTMAHLCAIYERIGDIPKRPKTLYRKIIDLLLHEWDEQRSVTRESRYAHFEVDRKFEFLCHLAFVLTVSLQKTIFTKDDLLSAFNMTFHDYDLQRSEAQQVVNELETHTGLILQLGSDRFEFAHKSLQEFLTAEHLVRLPSQPSYPVLSRIPNELAIAVAISSRPSDYFSELVVYRLVEQKVSRDFISSFLTRLTLEKPDFNSFDGLSLAIAILYSLYIDVVAGTWDPDDPMIAQFEDLLSNEHRERLSSIFEAYYEVRSVREAGKDTLLQLVKKENLSDFPFVLTPFELPKRLQARASLVKRMAALVEARKREERVLPANSDGLSD